MRFVLAFLLASSAALAQPVAPPSYTVEMTDQEEKAILEMCDAALWAARIKFSGSCEYLKDKFARAKAPKPAAEPSKP